LASKAPWMWSPRWIKVPKLSSSNRFAATSPTRHPHRRSGALAARMNTCGSSTPGCTVNYAHRLPFTLSRSLTNITAIAVGWFMTLVNDAFPLKGQRPFEWKGSLSLKLYNWCKRDGHRLPYDRHSDDYFRALRLFDTSLHHQESAAWFCRWTVLRRQRRLDAYFELSITLDIAAALILAEAGVSSRHPRPGRFHERAVLAHRFRLRYQQLLDELEKTE